MRNLKETITPLKNWLLFIMISLMITSCWTIKKLDLNELNLPNENEIPGTYSWSMRGHHGRIHLDSSYHFKYEFSNEGYKGYRVGTYEVHGSHLKLASDSIIREKWTDILAGDHMVQRSLDSTQFQFTVTKKGLHEKNIDGEYWQEPSFLKE